MNTHFPGLIPIVPDTSNKVYTELFSIVREGTFEEFKTFVFNKNLYKTLLHVNDKGRNILFDVVERGDKSILNSLLLHCCIGNLENKLVNHVDNNGDTLFTLALKLEKYHLFDLLISTNPDITTSGVSTIIVNYMVNDYDLIKQCLDNGHDVNSIDILSCTPLQNALIKNSDIKIIKLLIERGTDINYRNKFGLNALFYAKTLESVKLLVDKNIDLYATHIENKSHILHNLITFKVEERVEITDFLVKKGFNINLEAIDGPILSYAIFYQDDKMIDYILSLDDLDTKNSSVFCPATRIKDIENLIKKGYVPRYPGDLVTNPKLKPSFRFDEISKHIFESKSKLIIDTAKKVFPNLI